MDKTVDGILSFIYSFFNLFLAWVIVRSIGVEWDIAFLKPDVLTFQMYWGISIALGVMVLPALMAMSCRFKELDRDERLPTIVSHMISSVGMCLIWIVQLVVARVFF